MKVGQTINRLLRRWYILFPGLLLAGAAAYGAWGAVPLTYQRSATVLLLPGIGTIPEGGNPYLYLGGLTQASDVLARAIGSDNTVREIRREYPGAAISVSRDPSTAGPMLIVSVEADSDAAAAAIVDRMVERSEVVLDELQEAESIDSEDRISVIPITIDDESTTRNRTKMVLSGGAGMVVTVFTILLAALVEGLSRRSRRARRANRGNGWPDFDPATQDWILGGSARSTLDTAEADAAHSLDEHQEQSLTAAASEDAPEPFEDVGGQGESSVESIGSTTAEPDGSEPNGSEAASGRPASTSDEADRGSLPVVR